MNRNDISNIDAKKLQTINWLLMGIALFVVLIPMIIILFFKFSFEGFLMILFVILILCLFQYLYSNIWNIWIENDELYF